MDVNGNCRTLCTYIVQSFRYAVHNIDSSYFRRHFVTMLDVIVSALYIVYSFIVCTTANNIVLLPSFQICLLMLYQWLIYLYVFFFESTVIQATFDLVKHFLH